MRTTGGIIGLAEVLEAPRIQAELPAQLRFIRDGKRFAGDRLRVKLRLLKVIAPVIHRKYLLSRPELAKLSILRCPRGTNFRVTREQAEVLWQSCEEIWGVLPELERIAWKRIVFAGGWGSQEEEPQLGEELEKSGRFKRRGARERNDILTVRCFAGNSGKAERSWEPGVQWPQILRWRSQRFLPEVEAIRHVVGSLISCIKWLQRFSPNVTSKNFTRLTWEW
jgi:hypothetical protein